jgi:hypothetical protein
MGCRSESIANIAKALSSFQSKVDAIKKNKDVEVIMKSGLKYNYSYADQGNIFDSIKNILGETGLSYSQLIQENGSKLITVLMHESGEWLQSEIALMMNGDIKAYGGDITYKRRYALSAILGLATDSDDDGAQAPEQTPEQKTQQLKNEQQKPELTPESKSWNNAIKSYQEKGNLDAVKSRMTISEENEKLLIQASQAGQSNDPY